MGTPLLIDPRDGFAGQPRECREVFDAIFGTSFPCLFAGKALERGSVRMAVVDVAEPVRFAAAVGAFSAESRGYPGPATLSVVCLGSTAADVADYRAEFWRLLQGLHDADEVAWPQWLPADPRRREWEFCFAGESFFIVCSTPAHRLRRSRWTPHLTLTFQPSWVFDVLGTGHQPEIRRRIRKRLATFDECQIHPMIGIDGEVGAYSWKRYYLDDEVSDALGESGRVRVPPLRLRAELVGDDGESWA